MSAAADVIDVVALTMPDPIPPAVAEAHKRLLHDILAEAIVARSLTYRHWPREAND